MTHLAVLKGLSVPVPGEMLLSVCSTREKNWSRACDTLIPGLREGAETTASPQGHSRKSGGGEGTWKHQEAQALPEARSNLSSSRHIPLRFGFVSLRSSMSSPSRAVPCVSSSGFSVSLPPDCPGGLEGSRWLKVLERRREVPCSVVRHRTWVTYHSLIAVWSLLRTELMFGLAIHRELSESGVKSQSSSCCSVERGWVRKGMPEIFT